MNSRERVLAMIAGRPVDHLPNMPITMMFAGDQTGAKYRDYATDYRVLIEAQIRTAETFGFDYVSVISDPGCEAVLLFLVRVPAQAVGVGHPTLAQRVQRHLLRVLADGQV